MEKMNEEPKWPFELFGIECNDGWKKIYEPILEKVVEYNKEHEDNPIEVHQIKEKFGSIRIYLSHYTDELSDMIDKAEDESEHTCEICGKYIEEPIVEHHWIYPMCRECYDAMRGNQRKIIEEFEKKVDERSKG